VPEIHGKKQGVRLESRNPLESLVSRVGVEPTTT